MIMKEKTELYMGERSVVGKVQNMSATDKDMGTV